MRRTRRFTRAPASVAAARRFATDTLGEADAEVLEAVELMVSELATNCIRHAETEFDLTIAMERGRIHVEVTDRAGGTPEMQSPGPEDPTGRGLQIVNMLADTWGVDRRGTPGKTVWFTVRARPTLAESPA